MPDLRDPEMQKILDAYRSADNTTASSATVILINMSLRTPSKKELMARVVNYPGILERTCELLASPEEQKTIIADAFLRMLMQGGQTERIATYPGLLQIVEDARRRVQEDFRKRVLLSLRDQLMDEVPDLQLAVGRPAAPAQNQNNVVRLFHHAATSATHTNLHQLYPAFRDACNNLGFTGNHRGMFELIAEAYGQPTRGFHDRDHAYKMANWRLEDISALASNMNLSDSEARFLLSCEAVSGCFHDLAYAQVDDGVLPQIEANIARHGRFDKGPEGKGPYSFTIHNDLTPAGKLVTEIFGFKPGQTIYPLGDAAANRQGGMNEYLSALMAADTLLHGGPLTNDNRKSIATITAIIEATIPFRTAVSMENLHKRLIEAGLNDRDAEMAVKGAVLLANRDVDAFCGGPAADNGNYELGLKYLLGGTWKLMPENNRHLRGRHYTTGEFLAIMQRNHGFLTHLEPTTIFHHFRGFPSANEMNRRYQAAGEYLKLTGDYLMAKVASASIIHAVARTVDPDGRASLCDFMSGITCKTFMALGDNDNKKGDELILFNTLVDRGDKPPYGWDIKESPIAAYLVQNVGIHETHNIAAVAADYLKGENPRHREFLDYLKATHPVEADHIYSALETVADRTLKQAAQAERSASSIHSGIRQIRQLAR